MFVVLVYSSEYLQVDSDTIILNLWRPRKKIRVTGGI